MERYYENHRGRHSKPRKLAFGMIVLVLGALLLADNLGMMPWGFKSIVFSWQMLLIGIGVLNLFGRHSFTGVILIFIGGFFLLPEIFAFTFSFSKLFWPILLIMIGILIIFRHTLGFNRYDRYKDIPNKPTEDNTEGFIDEVNIFGGSKQRYMSQSFKGGKITSIFGGSEIDLTQAQLAEGTNVLEMVCIFGGSAIIVPSDWHVRSEVVSILGGFADKRINNPAMAHDRQLIIKGVAIFGGGEIKSIKDF
jgi:predicted membrane protein